MKLAVIADVHANLEALDAVLADAESMGVTGVISLGDSVGYGPDPEAVVTRLALQQTLSVMGNHEQGLFSVDVRKRFSPDARASLEYTESVLSPGTTLWLHLLPKMKIWHGARFIHGAPPLSVMRYISQCTEAELRKRFASYAEDLCFVGHTHHGELIRLTPSGDLLISPLIEGRVELPAGCRHICNVGSVGQPRGPGKGAEYVVWSPEERLLMARRVPYDAAKTAHKILALGLPQTLAQHFMDEA